MYGRLFKIELTLKSMRRGNSKVFWFYIFFCRDDLEISFNVTPGCEETPMRCTNLSYSSIIRCNDSIIVYRCNT